jgi:5-methylcytosine-specific restriction enzyme A
MPPGWAQLRAKALARDGHRCQKCGAPATEVDHIVPLYVGGPNLLANLRSLCQSCHRRVTGRQGGGAGGRGGSSSSGARRR